MTNEELVVKIQGGEKALMPDLWQQVERFVANRAQRLITFAGTLNGVEFGDLYNSGYIALVSAVDTFDPDGGSAFIGWFALYLKRTFAEAGGYRTAKQLKDPMRGAVSLNAPLGDEEDGESIGDRIEDPSGLQQLQNIEEQLYLQQLHTALEKAFSILSDDEEAAVRRRYYEGLPLSGKEQTAEEKALAKLRRRDDLMQYIEDRTPYYLHVGVQSFQNSGESAVERIVQKREWLAEKVGVQL